MVVPGWQNFTNSSLVGGVMEMYNNAMGPWWIVLPFVFILFITYISTKSEGITAVIGIIGSIFLILYLPVMVHSVLYFIIAISLGGLIYEFAGKGE